MVLSRLVSAQCCITERAGIGVLVRMTYGGTHPQAYEEWKFEAQPPRLGRYDYVASHLSCGAPTRSPPRSSRNPPLAKPKTCPGAARQNGNLGAKAEAMVEHIYI